MTGDKGIKPRFSHAELLFLRNPPVRATVRHQIIQPEQGSKYKERKKKKEEKKEGDLGIDLGMNCVFAESHKRPTRVGSFLSSDCLLTTVSENIYPVPLSL